MWATADDVYSTDFVRVNLEFLGDNSDYVGAISPVRYEGSAVAALPMGDDVLEATSVGRRMSAFLQRTHPNSVFYALFRRDVLMKSLRPISWYFGFDWTVMLRLAQFGPVKRLKEGWLQRGAGGMSSDLSIITRSRTRKRHWLVPFYDLTAATIPLMRNADGQSRLQITRSLAALNWAAFRNQAAYEWGRLVRRRGQVP